MKICCFLNLGNDSRLCSWHGHCIGAGDVTRRLRLIFYVMPARSTIKAATYKQVMKRPLSTLLLNQTASAQTKFSSSPRLFLLPSNRARLQSTMSRQIESKQGIPITLPEGLATEQLWAFKPFNVCTFPPNNEKLYICEWQHELTRPGMDRHPVALTLPTIQRLPPLPPGPLRPPLRRHPSL